MQSLTDGLYTETFFYGFPYGQVIAPLPPEFDYEGGVLTNAGLLTCLPGDFTLEYGQDALVNDDAGLPYGGAPNSNDYYLRFPVLSWQGIAGLFLSVHTTDTATLTFDRAWSGYIGDTLAVVVNGMELLSVTGSAGYPWTRSSVQLPAGDNEIVFVLRCAPFSSGTVRQGQAQDAPVTDLFRFLRLTNLSISNVDALPAADNQRLSMIGESSLTANPRVVITSGQLTMGASADLLWPKKLSGPLLMQAAATLSTGAGSFVGKYGQLIMQTEAVLDLVAGVEYDLPPTAGGFALGASAGLSVESTLLPDPAAYNRPLLVSRVRMSSPTFVNGRPVSPLAISETEIEYTVEAVSLSKINPVDPANVLPVPPTHRWLSLGAHYDPSGDQLLTWFDTTGAGPSWSSPGAPNVYTPSVGNYAIRNRNGVAGVNYPAVHFDASHGDHLLAELAAPVGGLTFVLVGTFNRYRGALDDSCPILDYAGTKPIDYSVQRTPQRRVYPWADVYGSSILLDLVPANRQEPTVSKLAWSSPDGYRTSDEVVISDNTPMVLVYSLSGAGSFCMATPLLTGQTAAAGRMTATLPTAAVDPALRDFALGKARLVPPQNGSWSTATMSLLELSYFARPVSTAEATAISDFLVGLYSPVDQNSGKTINFWGSGNLDTEQCLIYAAGPEMPVALISGSRTTVTDLYLSDPDTTDLLSAFTAAGVPLVQVSNRDYTAIIDAGENTR